ncbi:BON domain-containing protein [Tahibacter harae]|uniref:BON domain-containing protein n=1 Tax=Tahibacter harae TaxID=2963937 RepID=A0ABT1QM18_9GAMM|nr:BON domain-containing protein [Tahibacter harae]MCQ4163497.1 BON domain-containing protein [Tahibacter harae]
MDDKQLRQNVIDELAFEPSIDAASIGVAAEHGVVTLSGHVSSYPQKMAAERAVWRVKGVRGIAQDIEVRLPGHKRRADDEIAQRAVNILAWNTQVPQDAVKVRVSEGWVTLSGEVSWNHQRTAAEKAVRELSGVVGVFNQIEIAPHVQPADVKQRIATALSRHARLEADRIGIVVDGTTVTLSGDVDSWDERIAAESAAWAVSGVRNVVDRLRIT